MASAEKYRITSKLTTTIHATPFHKRIYSQTETPGRSYSFSELATSPLIVDAIYEGGRKGNTGDDPLSKLIPGCSNMGGFRTIGGQSFGQCALLVLSSSGVDTDWPDRLDKELGLFTYYGDNKKPGHELHDTPKGGNRLLEKMFGASSIIQERAKTPPILVFIKTGRGRDVIFRGLAVPNMPEDESLVAIWRQTSGKRFQNYRSTFAILDCKEVQRAWLVALSLGDHTTASKHMPAIWNKWLTTGSINVLRAPQTIQPRTKEQQLPSSKDKIGLSIVGAIRKSVEHTPHDFEFLAVEIFRMIEPRVVSTEITRKSADGGRDAVGRLRIGGEEGDSSGITCEFALEAKAYAASNGVGVKETSRLISRLRHRQFGVIVTTSYVSTQAYKELLEDNHPVIIIAAADIARIFRNRGIGSEKSVTQWASGIISQGSPRKK